MATSGLQFPVLKEMKVFRSCKSKVIFTVIVTVTIIDAFVFLFVVQKSDGSTQVKDTKSMPTSEKKITKDVPQDDIFETERFVAEIAGHGSLDEEADRLVSYLNTNQVKCENMKRMGHAGEGGWMICVDEKVGFSGPPCTVLSFGIGDDWSFDKDMAKQRCTVHAFDPSINQLTHKEDDNLYFYNLGLAGKNTIQTDTKDINHPTWRLHTLSGIMKTLNIENKKIAVLKIDIEGMEWESLHSMLSDGTLQYVKQLVLEIHIGAGDLDSVNNELLRQHYSDLKWLESQGFKLFNSRKNPVSHKVYLGSKYLTYACCFDLSWVNTRYNNWWGIT